MKEYVPGAKVKLAQPVASQFGVEEYRWVMVLTTPPMFTEIVPHPKSLLVQNVACPSA